MTEHNAVVLVRVLLVFCVGLLYSKMCVSQCVSECGARVELRRKER